MKLMKFQKKSRVGLFALLAMLTFLPGMAFAAIDGALVDAAYTEITTDANLMFTKAFPIVSLILSLTIGLILFKRFTKKAV